MSKRVAIVVITAAAAVFGVIAISQAASSPVARTGKRTPLGRTSRVAVSPVLYRRFSVLRSGRAAVSEPGATLPAEYAEHLTEPGTLVSGYELEPAQAKTVDVNGAHFWVIPGAAGLCLGMLASDGAARGTTCGPLAEASTDGLLIVQRPPAGPVIYGLVPNGDSVTVTDTDRSRFGIPVDNNVFKDADPSAETVAVRAPDGRTMETVRVAGGAGE